MTLVTSLSNPRVVDARKLLRRSGRDRAAAFLAEGEIVVADALGHAAPVQEVFVAEDAPAREAIERAAAAAGAPVVVTTARVIEALSDARTPQGVVAVVRSPDATIEDVCAGDLAVVLEQVRDPGNAGTLVRSAAAAGAAGIVFTAGSVDPLHPKTVRAAAGSLFALAVVRRRPVEEALHALRAAGFALVGADARAPERFDDVDLRGRIALVLGNESWGIGPATQPLLDDVVGIPMPGPVESLNVGIAGSILLFEIVRRRRGAAAPGRG